jgi:branched-subunit amino acid transport protein
MTVAWPVIVALCLITVVLKAAGPLTLGGRQLPPRAAGVIALVAPAVLAALVTYETFTPAGRGLEIDARVVGLGVAAVATLARLPMLVVVLLAAAATAGLRAVA